VPRDTNVLRQSMPGYAVTLKCDEHGARFFLHQGGARLAFRPKMIQAPAKAEANIRITTGSRMKLVICVGILATIICLPVRAQTISELALDQAGAQTVLQTAKERPAAECAVGDRNR
jgi:hypothetical protein